MNLYFVTFRSLQHGTLFGPFPAKARNLLAAIARAGKANGIAVKLSRRAKGNRLRNGATYTLKASGFSPAVSLSLGEAWRH